MAHTVHERRKLLARINRIEGQVKSMRIALEQERECATILQQIAACRGAINSLLVEIVDGEIRYHVLSRTAKVIPAKPAPPKTWLKFFIVISNKLYRKLACFPLGIRSAPRSALLCS
jgi:DNA-binding FrmR family transcriptional regulator